MSSTDDRDPPHAEQRDTRIDDAADRIAAVAAERDAAWAASYRQRERLQEEIDRAQRLARGKDRELRRTRIKLDWAEAPALVSSHTEERTGAGSDPRRRPTRVDHFPDGDRRKSRTPTFGPWTAPTPSIRPRVSAMS